MSRFLTLLLFVVVGTCVRAQTPQTYTNDDGDTHLVGSLQVADLQRAPYAEWYAKNTELDQPMSAVPEWADRLKDVSVEIFLGTWCGDSKTWVPRFVTLWQDLGLDPEQLDFIGLYGRGDQYKQGPSHEETGRKIHRVPTFVFTREGEEIARIVERPRTDLVTDVAQIALGHPAAPRYAAANYLLDVLADTPADSIDAHLREHFGIIRRDIGSTSELNTLGYVLLRAGRIDAAVLAFRINAFVFRHSPNILDSYAEGLLAKGETAAALQLYERVLELTPEDERVAGVVADLREQVKPPGGNR
ncbi:MAG: hypothetical protein AAFZ52_04190 [Bacteroidota bacterium]